jgi:hypothetical protein
MQSLFALKFDRKPAFHNQIGTEAAIEFDGVVNQGHSFLSLDTKSKLLYFVSEASLIGGFKKPGPSLRWILIAAPMTSGVRSLGYIRATSGALLSALRGLPSRSLRLKALRILTAKDTKKPAKSAQKTAYSPFGIKQLVAYPTAKVVTVPIITHHVHGTGVHFHKYNSTLNPNSRPTIAPR